MMQQQAIALLKLAWERSSRDIRDVYFLWIGGLGSVTVFIAFTLLNMNANFQQHINTLPASGIVTVSDALVASGLFAVFNTLSFFTFVFVAVCLFEYSLAFLQVCFYYDDGNWNWFQRKHLKDETLKTQILHIKRKKELIDTL